MHKLEGSRIRASSPLSENLYQHVVSLASRQREERAGLSAVALAKAEERRGLCQSASGAPLSRLRQGCGVQALDPSPRSVVAGGGKNQRADSIQESAFANCCSPQANPMFPAQSGKSRGVLDL